jgi:hypothetical protein
MRNIRQVVLIACLALSSASPGHSQQPRPSLPNARSPEQAKPEKGKQSAEPAQRGTDSAPLVVKLAPSQLDQIAPAQQSQEGRNKATAEWWMAALTAGLFVVAFFQLLLFWRQLRIMNTSLRDTEAAALAARKAAIATEASVELAKDTAHRQLRAYVNRLDFLSTEGIPHPNGTILECIVAVRNDGATPALKLVGAGEMVLQPIGAPPPSEDWLTWSPNPVPSVLGPGQTHEIVLRTSAPITPEEMNCLNAGVQLRLFALCCVRYEDSYGSPHWLAFSIPVDMSSGGGAKFTVGGQTKTD